jgi:hypothetical protein
MNRYCKTRSDICIHNCTCIHIGTGRQDPDRRHHGARNDQGGLQANGRGGGQAFVSQKRPTKCQKRPIKCQRRPKCQERPTKCQKSTTKCQKRPTVASKWAWRWLSVFQLDASDTSKRDLLSTKRPTAVVKVTKRS